MQFKVKNSTFSLYLIASGHIFPTKVNFGSRLEYHVYKYLSLLGSENEVRISNGSWVW